MLPTLPLDLLKPRGCYAKGVQLRRGTPHSDGLMKSRLPRIHCVDMGDLELWSSYPASVRTAGLCHHAPLVSHLILRQSLRGTWRTVLIWVTS